MAIRFFMIIALGFILTGCATTSKTSPVNQLQIQMTEMQQRMEDQEKEIVDLKYELKEVSGKIAEQPMIIEESSPVVPMTKEVSKPASSGNFDIIRVNGLSGRTLQKALKAAGVYTGKIDGQIGSKTKAAVVEFQGSRGLKADGIVGQKTWAELKAVMDQATDSTAEPVEKQ